MKLVSNNYSSDLKLRIIHLYCNKTYNVKQLTDIFNVSKSSIYNWINDYKSNKLTIKKQYIKPTSKYQNNDIRNIILVYVNQYPNFIYCELIKYIYKITN